MRATGTARNSAAGPTAAATVWTNTPEATPSADRTPAPGPSPAPRAGTHAVSGPGETMTATGTAR